MMIDEKRHSSIKQSGLSQILNEASQIDQSVNVIVEDISDNHIPMMQFNKETFAVKRDSEETMHEHEDEPVKLAKPVARKYATTAEKQPFISKQQEEEDIEVIKDQLLVIGFDNKPKGKNPFESRDRRQSLVKEDKLSKTASDIKSSSEVKKLTIKKRVQPTSKIAITENSFSSAT